MENINDLLIKSTEEYMNSNKLKEFVDKKAEEMVNGVVSDAFSWNGKLNNQFEDIIKNQLSINVKKLGIEGQNKFITEIVAKKLKGFVRGDVEKSITESLSKILSPIEKEISLDRLIRELVKSADTSDIMCGCDADIDYILENVGLNEVVTFETDFDSKYKWVRVYFDKEPNKSTHECEFKFVVYDSGSVSISINNRAIKAVDKLIDPYIRDIEDFVYSMFLNNCTMNYEELKNSSY
jgi:hypothetical protein